MTIEQALAQMGVTSDTLSTEEKNALDRDGYLSLGIVLDTGQIAAINARLTELLNAEGVNAGKETHQEPGTDRLADLVNKGEIFRVFYSHPRVLAAVAHVLSGQIKLSSLNARVALPGQGLQGLHADYGHSVKPGDYRVCNSIWLLDDFTETNGATRVVPQTHRSGQMPHEVMANPSDSHPDEQLLIAPAGTVVVFNSHTWHGGTQNRTDNPRRAVHSYFCRSDEPQQLNQQTHLREETRQHLSPATRTILDVS